MNKKEKEGKTLIQLLKTEIRIKVYGLIAIFLSGIVLGVILK